MAWLVLNNLFIYLYFILAASRLELLSEQEHRFYHLSQHARLHQGQVSHCNLFTYHTPSPSTYPFSFDIIPAPTFFYTFEMKSRVGASETINDFCSV
jgi:hypothetical protein